jgi:antiviral helicase SKI2
LDDAKNVLNDYHEALFKVASTSILIGGRVMIVSVGNLFYLGSCLKSEIRNGTRVHTLSVLNTREIGYLPFPSWNSLLITGGMTVMEVNRIVWICNAKLKLDNQLEASLLHLWENNQLDEIQPKDLKISHLDVVEGFKRKSQLLSLLKESKCFECPKYKQHFDQTDKKNKISTKIAKIQYAISDDNLALKPEYEKRIQVLKHLKYIDHDNTVLLKGRVACEINSCEELILTEMIFENIFTALTPLECVSILSCLICQEKTEEEISLSENLVRVKETVNKLTSTLGEIQREYGLDTNGQEYSQLLKFDMMEVAYEWANGASFEDITKLTPILEGSIVRSISQIDQCCREVRNCARVIGDANLFKKMEECSGLIKRDIIFAASLYVV